jgi:hypothetical protein
MTRRLSIKAALFLGAFAMSATAHAAERAQRSLAFVACPIMRDTTTVPCWLAEYEGELYYLTIQVDTTVDLRAPQLGYKVLVEGSPSDKPRICGGIPLEPVQLSVMPERSPECQTADIHPPAAGTAAAVRRRDFRLALRF